MHKSHFGLDPNIIFQQAFTFQQNNKFSDAEFLYRKILEIKPSHPGAQSMLGTICIQTGKTLEGIKYLEKSLQKDPKQFWALNTLGVGFLNISQYQKALINFKKAIAIKPEYIDAHFNLAKVQRRLNKPKDAILSYSKCISLDKNYSEAFNNRANIFLEDLNEPEKALSDYRNFLKAYPNSAEAHDPGLSTAT